MEKRGSRRSAPGGFSQAGVITPPNVNVARQFSLHPEEVLFLRKVGYRAKDIKKNLDALGIGVSLWYVYDLFSRISAIEKEIDTWEIDKRVHRAGMSHTAFKAEVEAAFSVIAAANAVLSQGEKSPIKQTPPSLSARAPKSTDSLMTSPADSHRERTIVHVKEPVAHTKGRQSMNPVSDFAIRSKERIDEMAPVGTLTTGEDIETQIGDPRLAGIIIARHCMPDEASCRLPWEHAPEALTAMGDYEKEPFSRPFFLAAKKGKRDGAESFEDALVLMGFADFTEYRQAMNSLVAKGPDVPLDCVKQVWRILELAAGQQEWAGNIPLKVGLGKAGYATLKRLFDDYIIFLDGSRQKANVASLIKGDKLAFSIWKARQQADFVPGGPHIQAKR
jgi:hypothetical protein